MAKMSDASDDRRKKRDAQALQDQGKMVLQHEKTISQLIRRVEELERRLDQLDPANGKA